MVLRVNYKEKKESIASGFQKSIKPRFAKNQGKPKGNPGVSKSLGVTHDHPG